MGSRDGWKLEVVVSCKKICMVTRTIFEIFENFGVKHVQIVCSTCMNETVRHVRRVPQKLESVDLPVHSEFICWDRDKRKCLFECCVFVCLFINRVWHRYSIYCFEKSIGGAQ